MQIADLQSLTDILSRIDQVKYSREYKTALSQVHADILTKETGAQIRQSLRLIRDFNMRMNTNLIIKAIGVDNFVNNSANDVLLELDNVYRDSKNKSDMGRKREFSPEPANAPYVYNSEENTYKEPASEVAITEPGEEEADAEKMEDLNEEAEQSRFSLTVEKVEEYKRKEYPAWRVAKADRIIKNIDILLNNIRSYYLPANKDPSSILDTIDSWFSDLDKFLSETNAPIVEETKAKKGRVRIVKKHQTTLDADDDANLEEAGKDVSSIDDGAILSGNTFANVGTPFISLREEDGVPVFNIEAINQSYESIKERIRSISIQTQDAAGQGKRDAGTYRRAFNELFHSVKVKDQETKAFIYNNEDAIKNALGGASNYNSFIRESLKYYLSTKLIDDLALFQEIYWSLAYCLSYSLFGHIKDTKPVTFKMTGDLKDTDTDIDKLRDSYLYRAMETISSKWGEVFYVNSPRFYSSRKDTLSELKVNTGMLILRTFKSLYGAQRGLSRVAFNMSLCPVCFKEIRWSRPRAYKDVEEYMDFEAPTVLPFSINDGTILTEKVMNSAGAYNPPAGFTGKKTWGEIKDLISSNSTTKHKEGWLRRAEALMFMGGESVGMMNVNKAMFKCPQPTGSSSCGISLKPLSDEITMLPMAPVGDLTTGRDRIDYAKEFLSLDSSKLDKKTYEEVVALIDGVDRNDFADSEEYLKIKRGLRLLRSKVKDTSSYEGLSQPGWTPSSLNKNNGSYDSRVNSVDESLKKSMKEKAAGGFKFSSSLFKCPCHISPKVIKNSVSGSELEHTHFTYAIPYAGAFSADNTDFVKPTNPEGGPSNDLLEGEFGYLICGAQTSLSSFDRDIKSDNGFVSMMRQLFKENQEKFLRLVEYFLKEGVDVSDIMSVLPYISEDGGEEISATSELLNIRNRITKLSDLFSVGMAKKGDELFDTLRDFVLICPFGHKFTIDSSLNFGNSHASMSLRKGKMVNYSDLVRGRSSSMKFLIENGDLFRIEKNTTRNYKYYKDWMLEDPASRVVNLFTNRYSPDGMSPEQQFDRINNTTFLKFAGPDGDYAIKDSLRIAEQAWSGDSHGQGSLTRPDYISLSLAPSLLPASGNTPVGDSGTLERKTVASRYNEDSYNIDNADNVAQIPGSYSPEDAAWDEYVDSKRLSLARAIGSALTIIRVWNNGIVNQDMAAIFTVRDSFKTPDISGVTSIILEQLRNVNGLKVGESWSATSSDTLKRIIEENVETFGIIKPTDTPRSIAKDIVSESIKSFILDTDEGRSVIEQENKASRSLKKESPKIAEMAVQNNQDLVNYLASTGYAKKDLVRSSHKEKYIQKMFLLAFSSHLAKSISNIASDYFVEGSATYIGYYIGRDLTDYKQLMNISKEDITAIEDEAQTLLDDYSIFGDLMSVENNVDKTDNIDKAYLRLINVINWGNRFALSSANIERAKEFVSETLSKNSDETSEWFRSELNKFFPVAKLDLLDSHTKVWHNRRVPITGGHGGRQIVDMPDTRFPGGTRIVNPTINFDSSKMQIGMISSRPSKEPGSAGSAPPQLWPPTQQGYAGGGFVGLTIPVRGGTAQNTSSGSVEFKVLSYDVSIDINGRPIDISFLFQRGFTLEDRQVLARVERLIEDAESEFSKAIDNLGRELSGEEYDNKSLELRDAHQLRLSELRGRREEVPLRYRTDTTSFHYDPRAHDIEQPFFEEDEFLRRFAVPEGKTTYKGYPGHRKSEVSAILGPIKGMYKRYKKSKDPTIADSIKALTTKLAKYRAERQSSEVSLMLTDPIHAYKLINSTALTGSSMDDDTRADLLDFIMDVYGGYRVLEIAQNIQKNRDLGKPESERMGPVTAIELLTLEKPDGTAWNDKELALLNKELIKGDVSDSVGWANHVGLYYDIYQGSEDQDDSVSNIQYVYGLHTEKSSPTLRPPVNGIPNISDIRNVKTHGKGYGVDPERRKSSNAGNTAAVARNMANRTRSSMLKYIENSTKGISEYKPKATSNEVIDKISKRRNSVAGIMNSRMDDLIPSSLIEESMLEVYYNNIIYNR